MNNQYLGRLVKLFWMLSLLVFLGVLSYVYVQLPPFITFTTEFSALSFLNFDKSNLFYWSLAIFVISNLAWYSVSKLLKSAYQNNKGQNKFLTHERISSLTNWFNSFSGLINVVIILSLIFINLLFAEEKSGFAPIVTAIYIFLGLIAVWFLLLAYLIFKNEKIDYNIES